MFTISPFMRNICFEAIPLANSMTNILDSSESFCDISDALSKKHQNERGKRYSTLIIWLIVLIVLHRF